MLQSAGRLGVRGVEGEVRGVLDCWSAGMSKPSIRIAPQRGFPAPPLFAYCCPPLDFFLRSANMSETTCCEGVSESVTQGEEEESLPLPGLALSTSSFLALPVSFWSLSTPLLLLSSISLCESSLAGTPGLTVILRRRESSSLSFKVVCSSLVKD